MRDKLLGCLGTILIVTVLLVLAFILKKNTERRPQRTDPRHAQKQHDTQRQQKQNDSKTLLRLFGNLQSPVKGTSKACPARSQRQRAVPVDHMFLQQFTPKQIRPASKQLPAPLLFLRGYPFRSVQKTLQQPIPLPQGLASSYWLTQSLAQSYQSLGEFDYIAVFELRQTTAKTLAASQPSQLLPSYQVRLSLHNPKTGALRCWTRYAFVPKRSTSSQPTNLPLLRHQWKQATQQALHSIHPQLQMDFPLR